LNRNDDDDDDDDDDGDDNEEFAVRLAMLELIKKVDEKEIRVCCDKLPH